MLLDHFRPAVERAFADKPHLLALRFHDLRHTSAALAIALNANPKTIQQRLGHASIQTTFDVYGHLFEGHDGELADALGEVYRGAVGRPAEAR